MPYVDRDESGNIKGVYMWPAYEGQESLPDNHPDVIEFFDAIEEESKKNKKILEEMDKITRDQAIANLIARGDL